MKMLSTLMMVGSIAAISPCTTSAQGNAKARPTTKTETAARTVYEPLAHISTYGRGSVTSNTFMSWLGEVSPPELFDLIGRADRQWLIKVDLNAGARSRTAGGDDLCFIAMTVRLWSMKDPFGAAPLGRNIDRWPFYGVNTVVEGPGARNCEEEAKRYAGEGLREVTAQLRSFR